MGQNSIGHETLVVVFVRRGDKRFTQGRPSIAEIDRRKDLVIRESNWISEEHERCCVQLSL